MTARKSTPDKLIKAEHEKVEKARHDALATLLDDPEQAEAAQAKALVPQPTTATAVAPVTDDPVQDYLDTYTVPTIPGTQIRFNGKDAKYVLLNGDPLGNAKQRTYRSCRLYGYNSVNDRYGVTRANALLE